MQVDIIEYTQDRIEDVVRFEKELRVEEDVWGWEIDDEYLSNVKNSFVDQSFKDSISLLAYVDDKVVGRIDCCMLKSHFCGETSAYLDWICVLKSYRHHGIAQKLLGQLKSMLKVRGIKTMVALTAANEEAQRFYQSVENAEMHDVGIWMEI